MFLCSVVELVADNDLFGSWKHDIWRLRTIHVRIKHWILPERTPSLLILWQCQFQVWMKKDD